MNADPQPPFPCPVLDEAGTYKWSGNFRVSSRAIETFAILTWTRRDLTTALAMIRECCKDEWDDQDSPVSQALWWSAVIIYGKPFKRSGARKLLGRSWAVDHLKTQVSAEALDLHEYLMHLRDKMMAHDDGLGERKDLVLSLPPKRPAHFVHLGIGTANRRVVSLGTDIAKQLEPHFADVERIFVRLWQQQFDAIRQLLLDTNFADVTLLGPHVEEEPLVDIQRVLDAYGRAGGASCPSNSPSIGNCP